MCGIHRGVDFYKHMKQTVDFTFFRTIVFVMLWLDVSEEAEEVMRQLDSDCTGTDLK